ncbi:cysteine hydrolase family protein [Halalkalibaculum sp. DA3122]|uniref:cysteine hydrolase family protein n=1 Tax=unclassified Halalkalibaculum TaxID=2964617 RepID=UPI003753F54D
MGNDRYTQPDWSRSALLTIDMQEDFTRPDAPAYIHGTEEMLENLQDLLSYFRHKKRPVFHIVRLYRRDGSNVDLCRRASVEQGNQVVAPGTPGAELVHELKPDTGISLDHNLLMSGAPQPFSSTEWALFKPRWGAFYQTRLQQMLQKQQVNTVVIAGCNFPNCPRTTIYEASERDFKTVLIQDATSGVYKKGIEELKKIGVSVIKTEELV